MPHPLTALIVAGLLAALLALVFWPRFGVVARWQRYRRRTDRTRSEDALKHLYQCEATRRRPSVQSIAGALEMTMNGVAELLPKMQKAGLVEIEGDDLRLTPRGRASALHIIRAHRLWERHLADETGVAEADWHDQAEQYEHTLSPVQVDELSAHLGNPAYDPHGDPIPTTTGELAPAGGQPLTTFGVDAAVRILHLEDEPAALYAEIVANGLHPGMVLRLLEKTPERVRFWADGDVHVLAPIVAANISVVLIPDEVPVATLAGQRLSQLAPGEVAEVLSLSPACRGLERRRLMDLGILPGTVITAELRSPSGDPTAYRIRGALIALRRDQAALIHVRPVADTAPDRLAAGGRPMEVA
jgi:DtxR family Mn-dependent transcriptional regulator